MKVEQMITKCSERQGVLFHDHDILIHAAINIMLFHFAKLCVFDIVFIIGCSIYLRNSVSQTHWARVSWCKLSTRANQIIM